MTKKERIVQEAVGSLKVTEMDKKYDIKYAGPKEQDPGFIITMDGEQIPLTRFDDVLSYFERQVKNVIYVEFVPDDSNGEVIRDRVKHIEISIRITHTDA